MAFKTIDHYRSLLDVQRCFLLILLVPCFLGVMFRTGLASVM